MQLVTNCLGQSLNSIENRRRCDVLIIGAGIIGLSTAYHMKQSAHELNVFVIDRNVAPAQGDTAKNQGGVRDVFTSDVNRLLAKSSIDFWRQVQYEKHVNSTWNWSVTCGFSPRAGSKRLNLMNRVCGGKRYASEHSNVKSSRT